VINTGSHDVERSIVVVNYNGGSKLLDCVSSVCQNTSKFELILVDNGSTDDSVATVSLKFPNVIVLRNSRNMGFAKANNTAIKIAQGKWIVLLNPDTRVTDRWLDHLVDGNGYSSQVGIITPKLLRMDGKTIDSVGHVFDFTTGYTGDRGSGEIDNRQYQEQEEVASCSFACAAIKREVINHIGFLDEKMVLYFEDVDYCIRARIAGWKVLYRPQSTVFHVRGGVTPKNQSRIQRWAVAYRLRIILKCYRRFDALKYGFLRIVRDLISGFAGMKNNDLDYSIGYFRSPLWNLLNLPIAERWLVQSTRKMQDDSQL
jgi:GT2 family glycosyltransferase